jgi:hypothetical protein
VNLCGLIAYGDDVTNQRDCHDGKERGCANKKTLSAYHFCSIFSGFATPIVSFVKLNLFRKISNFQPTYRTLAHLFFACFLFITR